MNLWSDEVSADLQKGGKVVFGNSHEWIEWYYASPGWKNMTRMQTANFVGTLEKKNGVSTLSGQWVTKDDSKFKTKILLTEHGNGCYQYQAEFQLPQSIEYALFAPILRIPVSSNSRIIQIDQKKLELPAVLGKRTIYEEKEAAKHTLVFQSGNKIITLEGFYRIVIQDDRFYKQKNFSVRLIPAKTMRSGNLFSFEMKIMVRGPNFMPINIASSANMGFSDKIAEDGKGGWTDQGPQQDLRCMTPGKQMIGGVLFQVLDPKENDNRSCIVLSDGKLRRFPSVPPLEVNKEIHGKYLYLLHASAWPRPAGQKTGEIRVVYLDGTESKISVISARDCGNWTRPTSLENAFAAKTFVNSEENIGLYVSVFPVEDKPIREFHFNSGNHTVWMIVGMTLSDIRFMDMQESPLIIKSGKNWAPLATTNKILSGSPIDLSFSLDAPAGKYGWTLNRDGKFQFEKLPGKNIRFSGVNLCHQHCFMPHATTDAIVDRIRKMGYNSVRLHHIDRKILNPKASDSFTFDPKRVDELNYLFHKCREAGLYITIDLFSMRPLKKGDGIENGYANHSGMSMKVLIPLCPEAMDSWKRYVRQLMFMKNPYTGLTWGNDPALYSLNLVNESSLPSTYTRSPELLPLIERKFAEDLKERKITMPANETKRKKLLFDFLRRKEMEALTEMIRFVREEIGYRGLITNYNCDAWYYQLPLREKLDIVDIHAYHDHPTYPKNKWKLPAYYNQISSLEKYGFVPGRIAGARIFGKPFMLTEVQFCNPNIYRSEAGTTLAAAMAIQGYNAYYRFSYADVFEFRSPRFFAVDNEPVSQITEKMLHFLFVRGDIKEAEKGVAINWTDKEIDALQSRVEVFPQDFLNLLLYGKIGTLKDGKKMKDVVNLGSRKAWERNLPEDFRNTLTKIKSGKPFFSSTKEVFADPGHRKIRIVTPRSEAFSLPKGDCEGKVLSVRGIKCFTTVSLHSRKKEKLENSSDMLFFHVTNTSADGMRFSNAKRNLLEEWGNLPLLVERDSIEVSIRTPKAGSLHVYALNWDGSIGKKIRTEKIPEGLRFRADTSSGFMMYHITEKEM